MKETLKILREQHHFSQASLSSYLGISRQMYFKYENGEVEPPLKIVTDLCKLYKVDYNVLIDNKLAPSEKKDVIYKIKKDAGLQIASPKAEGENYSNKIISMLPKLAYSEQLKILSRLLSIIEKETQKIYSLSKNNVSVKKEALNNILKYKGVISGDFDYTMTAEEALAAFEYFSGRGEGLDYDKEKASYFSEKYGI